MGHIDVTGSAGFIGPHLNDRLLADGHTVVGIDSFEDYYPQAMKEADLEGARGNRAFTRYEVNILELAAEDAPGDPEAGGAEGSALAAQAGVRASWGSSFEVCTRNNELPVREDMRPRSRLPYGGTNLAGEHVCGLHANRGLHTWSDNGPAPGLIGHEPTMQSTAGLVREFAWLADVLAEWI